MLSLNYINEKETYSVSFKTVNQNVVQVTGDFPVKTSGFTLAREGKEEVLGDYSYYTTVYREVDSGAQFSNDGSVWVEPEPLPDIESPDFNPDDIPESYILTNAELTECVADLMYEVSCLQLGL